MEGLCSASDEPLSLRLSTSIRCAETKNVMTEVGGMWQWSERRKREGWDGMGWDIDKGFGLHDRWRSMEGVYMKDAGGGD